jgi:hypothetical protein
MPTRIQIRRSTALAWETANPILAEGEIALEKDTGRLKIGDAVTPWRALRYALDQSFSAADKTKLAGIAAGATAAGATGDAHASRTDNPHATTPAQIGAEPAGTVAAHVAAADAHSMGSITGLQAALNSKLSSLSLQKDGDLPRQITGINLAGAASITSVASGVATVTFAASAVEPQQISSNGAVTAPICLVEGSTTSVSLPSYSSGLKYTTIKNCNPAAVKVVGGLNALPHVQGAHIDASSSASSRIIASRPYSGIANGPYLLFSAVVRPDVQATRNVVLFSNSAGLGSTGLEIALYPNAAKETAKALAIRATSGSTTPFMDVRYNIRQGQTQHLLISVDLTVPRIQVAIDGILQTPYSTIFPTTTTELCPWGSNSNKTFFVGGHGATPFPWRGMMAQVYVNVATALDLSVASNVAKFFDGARPADLGPTGSLPTGSAPEIFLNKSSHAFFTNPNAGAPFTIDPEALASNWIASPAADALLWAEAINSYPSGYTLPAGEASSFARMLNGRWEVI